MESGSTCHLPASPIPERPCLHGARVCDFQRSLCQLSKTHTVWGEGALTADGSTDGWGSLSEWKPGFQCNLCLAVAGFWLVFSQTIFQRDFAVVNSLAPPRMLWKRERRKPRTQTVLLTLAQNKLPVYLAQEHHSFSFLPRSQVLEHSL